MIGIAILGAGIFARERKPYLYHLPTFQFQLLAAAS